MSISLYDFSAPVYIRRLAALLPILDKAATYATENKIEPTTLLTARLHPNMLPFANQIQMACSHAARGVARLIQEDPANLGGNKESFDGLKEMIASTISVLEAADRAKFAGAEEKSITFPVGDRTMTLSGIDYLNTFSMPQFYFHITTAYAILRHNGLNIGKRDFMGA